jgi:hypothetical protein
MPKSIGNHNHCTRTSETVERDRASAGKSGCAHALLNGSCNSEEGTSPSSAEYEILALRASLRYLRRTRNNSKRVALALTGERGPKFFSTNFVFQPTALTLRADDPASWQPPRWFLRRTREGIARCIADKFGCLGSHQERFAVTWADASPANPEGKGLDTKNPVRFNRMRFQQCLCGCLGGLN